MVLPFPTPTPTRERNLSLFRILDAEYGEWAEKGCDETVMSKWGTSRLRKREKKPYIFPKDLKITLGTEKNLDIIGF